MDHSRFLGADHPVEGSRVTLVGAPFDGTSSFRPGSRFGPAGVRLWSEVLETFSPSFRQDLGDLKFADDGDADVFAIPEWGTVSAAIREKVRKVLSLGSRTILIGGEHLVTLPAVEETLRVYPDLTILQMDAHLDLRDEYNGARFSHATVMRRVFDLVGKGRLFQFGVRSGDREEWELAKWENTIARDIPALARTLAGKPVYLTVDLDVLDPSIMPETGTPEPGGITFRELESAILSLRGLEIVAADVVEFCPGPGGGGPSGAVAAKVIRELAFLVGRRKEDPV